MKPSAQCYQLIKTFEGCRLTAYKCPAGIWTIGYGNTRYADGRAVKQGDTITQAQAETLLERLVETFALSVDNRVKRPIRQNEFDALVSLTYNIGIGAFEKSTLLRKVNAGAPAKEVAAEFLRWDKAGGKALPGLTRRRAAESKLYCAL